MGRGISMDERIRIRSTPAPGMIGRVAPRTVQLIVRRAVPALADFAVVFVVTGRSITGIAAAHGTAAGEKLLRDLRRVYRVRTDDLRSTVAQVVRTGRPALRRSILHEGPPHAPRGSVADLHYRLACRSALVLPICVGAELRAVGYSRRPPRRARHRTRRPAAPATWRTPITFRNWRRSSIGPRPATSGSTKLSTTATASARASARDASRSTPATATTGPPHSQTSPTPSARCASTMR